MFEGKSFLDILAIGGFTLYILLLLSCISVAKIKTKLKKQSIRDVIVYCESYNKPVVNVVKEGLLHFYNTKSLDFKNCIERTISVEVMNLEKYTSVIATIGGIAVYIGLFGTVLGIIRSFHDISFRIVLRHSTAPGYGLHSPAEAYPYTYQPLLFPSDRFPSRGELKTEHHLMCSKLPQQPTFFAGDS